MRTCPQCHAVHNGKKWSVSCAHSHKSGKTDNTKLCTGCKRVRDKIVLGTAVLEGDVILSRPEEVVRMIRREEEIEQRHNYCSRICAIRSEGPKMTVHTANSTLAIHIARQLKKTFKGKMYVHKNTPGHRPRNKDSEGTVAVKWTQYSFAGGGK